MLRGDFLDPLLVAVWCSMPDFKQLTTLYFTNTLGIHISTFSLFNKLNSRLGMFHFVFKVSISFIPHTYLAFISITCHLLTVTHAAPNPVQFYAAISNFLVLRVRAE